MIRNASAIAVCLGILAWTSGGPVKAAQQDAAEGIPNGVFSSLKARGIGPALTSGRIGDLAINPRRRSEWYVAVCSGGVWKTTNAGTTFKPIFDSQGSYSIGCLAMDPTNPLCVWVGTGENNSQRSVSFGDGVYRTLDGGATWKHLGLKDSEHIGMIAIDPRDTDVVYVAAQGPLWRSGGERGLYKTTDGGKTWDRVLHVSDDTGINEVHMDPNDPNTLYASAYQRRRRVWTLINGGPESGIWKSTDAGQTWREINRGLPGGDKGRIGLDIAPKNADVLYAIVESANSSGGVYRSTNRGESWQKRSSYMSSSPQYYNEIVCDPHDVDRLYSLDTYLQVSEDGGKTFSRVPRRARHVDDHALWIDPDDADHLIVGSDGGIYETWDRGANWHYKQNLPITQFYRVAVDNSKPFYNVYGGTQDNNTLGGPVRTKSPAGIANEDWFVTVGGDGFETQVDPEDPNIVYSQWQYGGLIRHDRRSGETMDIKPREKPGEEPYIWNWDSPLLISPHDRKRLYYAGNRLFRSDDQGNSWTPISGDLTRGLDRNQLEVMGKVQNVDAVSKNRSTSIFGTAIALDESTLVEGLIWVGTDDGLVHVTSDGGQTWRKIMVFPDVPNMTYVSCLEADLHDANTVYATFDNHKNGDFTPYVLKSTDRGETWTSISGDLPKRDIVYGIVQDHVDSNLLFVGTEFGAYFSLNGGKKWEKIRGVPTIAVKDIEIQRRENDVVLATFGRSFYILDDYTPMRHVTKDALDAEAHIFPVKPALQYMQTSRLGRGGFGSQGASYYTASNPPFGAVFTYHLKAKYETRREKRKAAEKKGKTDYPSVDALRAEDDEIAPQVFFTVRDETGAVVRRIKASRSKGLHRATWNLRYPATSPVSVGSSPSGPMALPGTYTVTLSKVIDGQTSQIAGPVEFEVVPLDDGTFKTEDKAAALAFKRKAAELYRAVQGASRVAGEANNRLDLIRAAVMVTPTLEPTMLAEIAAMKAELNELRVALNGDTTRSRRSMPTPVSISSTIGTVIFGSSSVTAPPTKTWQDAYANAGEAFEKVLGPLTTLVEEKLPALEAKLEAAGAPWTPGRVPRWKKE